MPTGISNIFKNVRGGISNLVSPNSIDNLKAAAGAGIQSALYRTLLPNLGKVGAMGLPVLENVGIGPLRLIQLILQGVLPTPLGKAEQIPFSPSTTASADTLRSMRQISQPSPAATSATPSALSQAPGSASTMVPGRASVPNVPAVPAVSKPAPASGVSFSGQGSIGAGVPMEALLQMLASGQSRGATVPGYVTGPEGGLPGGAAPRLLNQDMIRRLLGGGK